MAKRNKTPTDTGEEPVIVISEQESQKGRKAKRTNRNPSPRARVAREPADDDDSLSASSLRVLALRATRDLDNTDSIIGCLTLTARLTLRGRIDPRQASSIASLCNVALRAIEARDSGKSSTSSLIVKLKTKGVAVAVRTDGKRVEAVAADTDTGDEQDSTEALNEINASVKPSLPAESDELPREPSTVQHSTSEDSGRLASSGDLTHAQSERDTQDGDDEREP